MRLLLTADPELPVPPRLYGGIERIVASLIDEHRAAGITVGLVAHPESTAQTDAFYPWPGSASQNRKDTWRNLRALGAAIRDFRPDVLHSYSRLAYLFPTFLGRQLPVVMSYQRQPSLRTTRWASRIAGEFLTFTGCSEHICVTGRQGGGTWTPIPNFIDPQQLTFRESVAPDAPLVFLSRIERIKGTHTAIAIAQAADRPLIIAGNRPDDPQSRQYWETEVAPHLEDPRITYVGPVDNQQKDELLGKAAAMVVPIEWEEPFGIVFAESLACGTPVIATPRGAVPEIVGNGEHGFHVRSVEEGVEAVRQLPSIDRRACRDRVEGHFTSGVVAAQYRQLYTQHRGDSGP